MTRAAVDYLLGVTLVARTRDDDSRVAATTGAGRCRRHLTTCGSRAADATSREIRRRASRETRAAGLRLDRCRPTSSTGEPNSRRGCRHGATLTLAIAWTAMPELPEVETIRRHLAPHVEGRELRALTVLGRALVPAARARRARRRASMAASSSGSSRRGKYLVFELADEVFLMLHLRMTGTLLLDPPGGPRTRACASTSATTSSCSSTRAASGPASWRSATDARDAFFAARLGLEPFDDGVHDRRTCARSRGAAARRSRRSCSTRSGSPASATSTPTRRCSARASTRCGRSRSAQARAARRAARGRARVAGGRDRRQGRDDRRLPRPLRRQRLLPGPVPRAPARGASRARRCGTTVVKLRAAGRGTYVCPRCQPRAARRRRRLRPRRPRLAQRALRGRRAASSWKPPMGSPSMTTWGNVIMPVSSASSARPVGVLREVDLLVRDAAGVRRALAVRQKPHGSVV